VFDNYIQEPAYLSGMVAGGMTKSNKIGMVGGFPIPEVNRLMNAFMAGAKEDEVLANIQGKTEIREALDWTRYVGTEKATKLMPPRDSVQYHELKAAQDKDSNTLTRMRDVVPSLFGF